MMVGEPPGRRFDAHRRDARRAVPPWRRLDPLHVVALLRRASSTSGDNPQFTSPHDVVSTVVGPSRSRRSP